VVAAFCAGGVAGAVSRTVVSPLERLKILFQIQSVGREEYKLSVGKGLAKMWKDEGWRGFMRGNGTNCIRIVPYSAVQFGSYNFYKKVSVDMVHYMQLFVPKKPLQYGPVLMRNSFLRHLLEQISVLSGALSVEEPLESPLYSSHTHSTSSAHDSPFNQRPLQC
jgi:hypothetical protein